MIIENKFQTVTFTLLCIKKFYLEVRNLTYKILVSLFSIQYNSSVLFFLPSSY